MEELVWLAHASRVRLSRLVARPHRSGSSRCAQMLPSRQNGARYTRVHCQEFGRVLCRIATVRPARLVSRLELLHSAHIHSLTGRRSHGRVVAIRQRHGLRRRSHSDHLVGSRSRTDCHKLDQQRRQERLVGCAPKLPLGSVVDAQTREDLRGLDARKHARELPSVADQLSVVDISRFDSAERRQDDQRGAQRSALKSNAILLKRSHLGQFFLQRMQQSRNSRFFNVNHNIKRLNWWIFLSNSLMSGGSSCFRCVSFTRWFKRDASSVRSVGTSRTSSTSPICESACVNCKCS